MLRLWAPTATDVDLLLWKQGHQGAAPQRIQLRRNRDGACVASGNRTWRGAQYLYDIPVYVPSTRQVERNRVTDPYSLTLTTDSRRSVLVDLARDRLLQPR